MKHLIILIAVALMSACSQTPSVPPAPPEQQTLQTSSSWHQYSAYASRLHHWQNKGKMAIRLPSSSNTAYLSWQQASEGFNIRLSGPLGQGAVSLSGNSHFVTLTDSKGQSRSALSGEALMHDALGWSVPVENIIWWIRGLPAPEAAHTKRLSAQSNQEVRVSLLTQDGWTVSYSQYHSGPLGLPKRLKLERGDLRLVISISSWQGLKPPPDIDFNG